MNYQEAVRHVQGLAPTPPTFAVVRSRPAWRSTIRPVQAWSALMSVLASLSFAVVAVLAGLSARDQMHAAYAFINGPGAAAILPAVLLLVSARMTLRSRFVPQMLSRAIWWSNLIVGTLMAHLLSAEAYRQAGTAAALACGAAILITGARGLDHSVEDAATDRFRPVAYRGLLTVALVMAFADAQTLAFTGVLQLGMSADASLWHSLVFDAGPTFACAIVMAVAVWGLVRLRTWALLLNLVANLAIAGLALHGYLDLSPAVAGTLAATAFVQAFLPAPILARALGGPKTERAVVLPHGGKLATVAVVLGMLVAAAGLQKRGFVYSGWLDGQGKSFVPEAPGVRAPTDFRGVDLRGKDLRGLSVRGADFTGASLSGADLRSSRLPDSHWDSVELDGANLAGADLRSAVFSDLQAFDVDLRLTDLRGARFERVRIVGGNLMGADIDGATFNDVAWLDSDCPDGWATLEGSAPPPPEPLDRADSCETHGVPASDAEFAGTFEASDYTMAWADESMRTAVSQILGVPAEDLPARPRIEIELVGRPGVPQLRVGGQLLRAAPDPFHVPDRRMFFVLGELVRGEGPITTRNPTGSMVFEGPDELELRWFSGHLGGHFGPYDFVRVK